MCKLKFRRRVWRILELFIRLERVRNVFSLTISKWQNQSLKSYRQSFPCTATSLNKRGGAKALVAQKSILDIVIVYLKFENNKMKPVVLRIETTGIKAEENLLRCCGDIMDSVF